MGFLHAYEWLDGRYRLKEKIGQGSFGEVWLVLDTQLNQDVAAKICFGSGKNETDFEKEYKTTKKLDHPNLIHPLDYGVVGERTFIIMPYCPSSASKMIGCCNDMMAWEFLRDVSHGLAYLHKKGVVHHDIKPDNILMDESGRFKITDFGVSTQFGDYYHPGDEALKGGTEGYMGPEMFMPNAESVKATDIWALGATAYEMLSGELPFYGIGGRAQNGGAVLNEIHHHVSSNLMQLIRDCMAKETWDRPTAREIADYTQILFDESRDHPYWDEYFRRVRKKAPLPVWESKPESQHYPVFEPVKKRKLWWIPASAAAIAGIVIALWLANRYTSSNTNKETYSFYNNEEVAPESIESPVLVEATYLKVNGSDKPEGLEIDSQETSETVAVETDGSDFSVEIPKNCSWISLAAKTDLDFVLFFASNTSVESRINKIKVMSGALTTELPVIQVSVKAKVPNQNLKPTQTKHTQEPSKRSSNGESEKRQDPINLPVRHLNPVLY